MKKIVSASFLCGSKTRKKNPLQNPFDSTQREDSDHGGANSPETQQQQQQQQQLPPTDQEESQNQSLPPPPGRQQSSHHVRAASYHHQRSRSSSAVSRLTSSLSMKMRQSSRREEGGKNKKKLENEDSVWKKTIILGEKCRVPDEDDDTVLYDEKGKKISTYHPKNGRSVGSFSRQNSGSDKDSIFVPPRLFGSSPGKNR